MELRHFRYFEAVARTLSFSRAAEELHVAQPALSRQIKDLESEMEVKLFDRNRVSVKLTAAGRVFLPQITKILSQVDIAVTGAQEAARQKAGELIISNDWRITHPMELQAIVNFRKKHPNNEVVMLDLPLCEQMVALKEGRAHISFMPISKVCDLEGYSTMIFAVSGLRAIVPAGHALASKAQIKLSELRNETWIAIDAKDAHSYKGHLTDTCRNCAGFTPRFSRRAKSVQTLLAMISSGMGVAMLPEFMVPKNNPLIAVIKTDAPDVELAAVYNKKNHNPLVDDYLATLKALSSHAPAHAQGGTLKLAEV